MNIDSRILKRVINQISDKLQSNKKFMGYVDLVNEQEWSTFDETLKDSVREVLNQYQDFEIVDIQLKIDRLVNSIEIFSPYVTSGYLYTPNIEAFLDEIKNILNGVLKND